MSKVSNQVDGSPIDNIVSTADTGANSQEGADPDHAGDDDDFLAEFRASDADLAPPVREQLTVPLEKFKNNVFFQVHPSEKQTVYLFEDVDEKFFLIPPRLAAHPAIAEHVGVWDLHLGIDRQDNFRLLPVRRARPGETSHSAWDSKHAAFERAKGKWVRMKWNKNVSGFDLYVAPVQPAAPTWPEARMSELVKKAFEGRIITSEDHPAIRRLLGLE